MRTYEPTVYVTLITLQCEGCGQKLQVAQMRDSASDMMIRQRGGTLCDKLCKAKGTEYQAPLTVLGARPILEMYHNQQVG